jgi:hypothetical protein
MCTLATCQCGRGCIFNSGPASCDAHGNCNNRICSSQRGASCFKEFRAVQKASADPVRWILSSQGYEVPPGAVQIGVRPLRNYCELHNDRPNFAVFLLFSGAILQIAPAQSEFQQEIGRLLCNSQQHPFMRISPCAVGTAAD